MRKVISIIALLGFSFAAQAAFDITATMPSTLGATSCQLYLDGVVAGATKPCDSANQYPALIANPGSYVFTYKAVNATGESAFSPATTVNIQVIPPPGDPLSAPSVTVTCNPAPCNVVVTVMP